MWTDYVIDADLSDVDEGLYCVCPVELDDQGNITSVVTGMNYLVGYEGLKDYNIIAVVSQDGDDVAHEFYERMQAKQKGD